MRTTVTIDDQLLTEAKRLALQDNRTLGEVVEDGLRRVIAQQNDSARATGGFVLPVHGSGGLRPGVDLDDRDAIASLLDDEDRSASA